MKMTCYRVTLAVLFVSWACICKGQGCSDAGFCTINSFKPHDKDTMLRTDNRLKLGVSFGDAENSILAYGAYLEYDRRLSNKCGLDVKITTLAQWGNNIAVYGLSDAYLNFNYKAGNSILLTGGLKIPFSDGNKMMEGLSLPMDYQSSLGTLDLIVGIGFEIKKMQLVAALQQPVTQNSNGFRSVDYPPLSKLSGFQTTSGFIRSGDVLLRASYPIRCSKSLKITPNILPIYHLTDDQYSDGSGEKKSISGSHGLTLNGNVYLDYEIDRKHALQLNAGMPFIVRKSRPDGLTRRYVLSLEYSFSF